MVLRYYIKYMEKKLNPKIKKGFKMHLRTKNCIVCDKPFQFRKKWEDCWDEVKYCSGKCRNAKGTIKNKIVTE
jgi:hypothetical protein